jgi:hypothetical protein
MASKLPSWVKKDIQPVVREAYRDSDGFWLYLYDEYEVDNGSTVSGDTAAEAHSYFWSGSHNAELKMALQALREPAKVIAVRKGKAEPKGHNIYLLQPRVKPTGLTPPNDIPETGGDTMTGNPL